MNKTIIPVAVFMIFVSLASVSAFAVSSPYWNENPLKLSPGDSIDLQLVLKNNAGAEALMVEAFVSAGADIVAITDSPTKYNVPAGGETVVNLRVTIPASSPIGTSSSVKIGFKSLPVSAAGETLGISGGIDTTIPVMVVEKPVIASSGTNWTLYILIGVLVLIVLVFLLMRKKRK